MLRLFFGEFQVPPIGLEYELLHFESFSVDPFGRKYSWNEAKEHGGGNIVLVREDMAWDDADENNTFWHTVACKSIHHPSTFPNFVTF